MFTKLRRESGMPLLGKRKFVVNQKNKEDPQGRNRNRERERVQLAQ
jgi:hypothetical protein